MPINWAVTYAQAEGVLARLHGANGDAQRKTFRARLKHLKKLGVPLGVEPGRGKKISYAEEQLYQWAFCLEVAEFGLDPTHIVRVLREHWDEIKKHFNAEASRDFNDELLFVLRPAFLSQAMAGTASYGIKWFRGSGADLFWKLRSHRRAMVINVTHLLRELSIARVATDSALYASKR